MERIPRDSVIEVSFFPESLDILRESGLALTSMFLISSQFGLTRTTSGGRP